MRKIKCYCHTGYVGCVKEGVIEVNNDATEEDINEEFQEWLNNNIDMGWYELLAEGQKVKKWDCDCCGKEIEVLDDYKPQFCCSGFDCGCNNQVINPVICEECQKQMGMCE